MTNTAVNIADRGVVSTLLREALRRLHDMERIHKAFAASLATTLTVENILSGYEHHLSSQWIGVATVPQFPPD